jgi:hypothetical protein
MKNSIFWDITPCSMVKVNRRFGESYLLHLQGLTANQAGSQQHAELLATLYMLVLA